MVQNYILEVGF